MASPQGPSEPAPALACHACDQLHQALPLPAGGTLLCVRCGSVLRRCLREGSVQRCLALALAALLLFVLANAFPLLSLDLHGTVQTASLPECVRLLAAVGWPGLSAILLTTVELVPLARLAGLLLVLVQVERGKATPRTARVFRWTLDLHEWGMAEVFVLGILISYVKLSSMAVVLPGPSLWALAGYILLAAAVESALDRDAVWRAIREAA